jgi:hypothetical protein
LHGARKSKHSQRQFEQKYANPTFKTAIAKCFPSGEKAPRVYLDRIAGGDRHHCNSSGDAFARIEQGKAKGSGYSVHK